MYPHKKAYTISEAITKMEYYCSYRERCHKEVQDKLREMRMIPEAVDQIIAHLINEDYLNEERFARAFARGKHRIKSWGRNRIISELKFRNISKFNIKAALEEIDEIGYENKLHSLAKKRLAQIKDTDCQKRRRKLADYLLYRGWESHLVYEKIRELVQ